MPQGIGRRQLNGYVYAWCRTLFRVEILRARKHGDERRFVASYKDMRRQGASILGALDFAVTEQRILWGRLN